MNLEILQQLGVAVLLSTLIGLEREKKYQQDGVGVFGGLRTFALIGLIGALAMFLSTYSMIILGVLTVGFLALVVASYVMSAKKNENIGATSEIAAILVYIIGMLSAMGNFFVATSITLLVLVILLFKEPLHKWAYHIEWKEIISTIEFIIVAFIILPLLPNQGFGPYEFFNPYLIWLMVVFISGLSFLSYVAIRLFGAKRGISLTGFLAGFISSTALTLTYSSESKKNPKIMYPYLIAVVIASSAMFFRILVEVAVVNTQLVLPLLLPMLLMGGLGVFVVFVFWFVSENKNEEKVKKEALDVKSPFSLAPAIKFGLFFAIILFLAKFANDFMGNKGIYLASVASGILDVDAITLSVANLANEGLDMSSAVIAITLGAITNTLVKGMFFLFFGSRKVGIRIMAVFLIIAMAGGVSLLFI